MTKPYSAGEPLLIALALTACLIASTYLIRILISAARALLDDSSRSKRIARAEALHPRAIERIRASLRGRGGCE